MSGDIQYKAKGGISPYSVLEGPPGYHISAACSRQVDKGWRAFLKKRGKFAELEEIEARSLKQRMKYAKNRTPQEPDEP